MNSKIYLVACAGAVAAAAVQAKEGPHQRTSVNPATCLPTTSGPDMPKIADLVENRLASAASWAGAGPSVLEAQLTDLLLVPVVA